MPIASIPERQVAPSAPAHWITPEEQLLRLAEPITDRVSTSIPKIIPDLGRLIALYAIEADWYIALENLDSIPLKIPPLPNNITQIHEGPCWIYGKDRRQKDSHILRGCCKI